MRDPEPAPSDAGLTALAPSAVSSAPASKILSGATSPSLGWALDAPVAASPLAEPPFLIPDTVPSASVPTPRAKAPALGLPAAESRPPAPARNLDREDAAAHVLPALPAPSPGGRRRRPGRLTTALLVVVLAAIAGLGYVTWTARSWQAVAVQRGKDLQDTRASLDQANQKVQSLTSNLATTKQQLATTTSNLAVANARIRQLASDKANAIDHADGLTQLVTMSSRVSAELSRCVSLQSELFGYLANLSAYDYVAVMGFVDRVGTTCQQAQSDSSVLASALNRA
jgi:hypothetical protein